MIHNNQINLKHLIKSVFKKVGRYFKQDLMYVMEYALFLLPPLIVSFTSFSMTEKTLTVIGLWGVMFFGYRQLCLKRKTETQAVQSSKKED
jgi:hypothetical protein